MNLGIKIIAILILTAACGCAEVKPWRKGNLAKPHMAFDTDPVESKFTQHVYTSKEGTTGGYSVGGGGCGCN